MSDENYKVQVSLSAPPPAQYAKGAMANFRGDNVAEVALQLQEAKDSGLLELASEVESVWTAAAGLGARSVNEPEAPGRPAWSQPAQGATVTQAATAPAPSCQHGPRQWKSGQGKTGAWHAWFCSAAKGDPSQCPAVWANADGSPK